MYFEIFTTITSTKEFSYEEVIDGKKCIADPIVREFFEKEMELQEVLGLAYKNSSMYLEKKHEYRDSKEYLEESDND